jgi:glycolate oxidase iron-sulfur subunit
MQTTLATSIRDTPQGREADGILRSCVHCGFCNATCPTYQLLGDELDGPRGRIYLIKQMLEGNAVTPHTLLHLDRCLTCRNCETTCPSGVQYSRLLDIGRQTAEARVARPRYGRAVRWLLRKIIPYPARFRPMLRFGQWLHPVLPPGLKRRIPPLQSVAAWPEPRHARRVLLLEGCVQPALAPAINAATARVLDRCGISALRAGGEVCCGAALHHTSGVHEALDFARRNVDAWWPLIDKGIEALVSTASGCGVHVKDYGHLLRDDPVYAEKAQRISALTRDLSEVVAREDLAKLGVGIQPGRRIAFQSPCTLQHGQKLNGVVEQLLRDLGFVLVPVAEAHLCCGSAGTYSILQPDLSRRLLARKLQALQTNRPERIVTANIGCLTHLQGGADVPVQHWVELLG